MSPINQLCNRVWREEWQTCKECKGRVIIKVCESWCAMDFGCNCLHTADPSRCLFNTINSTSSTPEVCVWFLMPSCLNAVLQTLPGFPLNGPLRYPSPRCPIRNSSLSSGFFLQVQYWVFPHPVHSLQPQWGHLNIIHLFTNTLQTNWASGENTQSHLWCATMGPLSLHKLLSCYLYETSID